MFSVAGFLVGNAGLWVTLLQFFIAYGILLFTVASVCAVATNGAVEGGGAYCILCVVYSSLPTFGTCLGMWVELDLDILFLNDPHCHPLPLGFFN
jgi:potassium/chloride transporter 9